jgi:hypothetical protein
METIHEPGTTGPAALNSIGALALSLALLAGSVLWLRFGETIYIERILGALANCF